jgi:hypothetical protein
LHRCPLVVQLPAQYHRIWSELSLIRPALIWSSFKVCLFRRRLRILRSSWMESLWKV